jgi:hypothetical protein
MDRASRLDWILGIPSSSVSRPLKRVQESFKRLVSARKATLHALAEVGQDIIQLDEDLKTKKAWTAAASITGNHYCEKK